MASQEVLYTGSCLCRRVRYDITGPVKRTSHCFCTMCQKQHGAAFGTYANVASADFSYSSGAAEVACYESSPGVKRCFCQVCGSTLTWQSDAYSEVIGVTLGTFDTRYEGQDHQLLDVHSKAPWLP